MTIAATNARSLAEAFLQPIIPLTACQLRLCCSNGSIGRLSLVPPPKLQRLERINQLQDLDSGRTRIVTSNFVLWSEGDIVESRTDSVGAAVRMLMNGLELDMYEDRLVERKRDVSDQSVLISPTLAFTPVFSFLPHRLLYIVFSFDTQ